MAPVDRGERGLGKQLAVVGAPELAHHVKGVGEVHRRHRLAETQRQIGATERRVVRAHPAAQRDLDGEHG